MDSFIEKITYSCFPELLQPAVLLELKKPGNFRNQVQSLSRLCIRDIVRPRIKPESMGFVSFKLLFQEELDILKTSQLIRDNAIFNDHHGLHRLLCGFTRFLSRQLNIQLKDYPDIMQQVLEQNLNNKKGCWFIIILKKLLRVVLDDAVIVEEIHDNYNTEWALVFARICFEKNIKFVQIEVEIIQNESEAKELLFTFINQIGLVAPGDENWEDAYQERGNSIYLANSISYKSTRATHSVQIQAFHISNSTREGLDHLRRIYICPI